jgi:hypothetical protein
MDIDGLIDAIVAVVEAVYLILILVAFIGLITSTCGDEVNWVGTLVSGAALAFLVLRMVF